MSDPRHVMVGLGEVLWDMLPGGKQLGGAVANFACHAHALGESGWLVSAVGEDPLGRAIRDRLDALEVDTSCLACDPQHPTGTVSVEVSRNGQPSYTIHEDVAWDHIPWSVELETLLAGADVVCFGSLAQRHPDSRSTLRKCLCAVRGHCLKIFDVNLRQEYYNAEIIGHSMDLADVVKLNEDEWPVVCGLLGMDHATPEDLIRRFNLRMIVLTEGAAGSRMITPEGTSALPGRKIQVADTVGAGDAFTAATAVGLVRNLPVEDIHRFADKLAAFVCTRNGATPDLPEDLRAGPGA